MTTFPKITHVLYDMDGILLDTEHLYTKATKQILKRFGKDEDFTWEIKSRMMGKKSDAASKILIDTLGLPLEVDAYLKEISVILSELFPNTKTMEGVTELVHTCTLMA